jgi:septal ring factor EnvC (AmiA/AmiB activator)
MEQHRAEVQAWLGQESSRFAELTRLQQRQTTLLARLERERQSLTVQTAELSDKERKLANFLDFLYGRTPTALSGTPVQNFKGVLDWPIQARVERGFGPTLDPVYGTRVPHNGLDLATAAGAEVRAVFPGKVLFAAPFQGYGLTAVVHHPGRVFSLYAGLGELRVEAQDVLSLGQVIGIAADTLYFEIREENRPVDPAQWLR